MQTVEIVHKTIYKPKKKKPKAYCTTATKLIELELGNIKMNANVPVRL
jgi:hypothetical protein